MGSEEDVYMRRLKTMSDARVLEAAVWALDRRFHGRIGSDQSPLAAARRELLRCVVLLWDEADALDEKESPVPELVPVR